MEPPENPQGFTITIRSDAEENLPVPRPSVQGRLCALLAVASDVIHTWTPFMLVCCYFAFSVSIYMVCNDAVIAIFWFVYLALNFYVAASTVIEAFMSLSCVREARRAVDDVEKKGWKFPTPDNELPSVDLIIVAYLPNEKDIIKSRIHYLCNEIIYPKHLIRINCVYNTPKRIEPLETELRDLLTRYEQLRVIEVPNSTSKADNLNFFLSLEKESDIIGIYDCDHYPHPYAPRWAAERFAQNPSVDIVQGRCVIFNTCHSLLASLVSIEFDKIYACAHPGRAAMTGFGLFAGSNGYWRTALLCEHKMDGSMLTEDIDSALRAFAKGWNAVHDLNVVSFEMAPTSLKAFWRQRMRWAQGWTQASIRHLVLAWKKSPAERAKRSFSQRFGIFSLLLVREVSYYLVTQYTCLVFGFVITKFPHSPAQLVELIYFQYPVSQWCLFISIICIFAALWITYIVRNEFAKPWTIIAFFIIYPFYIVVVATMGVYAHAREIVAYSKWNPTARG